MLLHLIIDIFALTLAGITNHLFRKKYGLSKPASLPQEHQHNYLLVLIIGLVTGSIFFGTWNIRLSGVEGFSKSLIGGIAGAILFAEIFKRLFSIKGSTGFYFIPGLCVLIVVGRIGCFVAGLPDYTYGIPTELFLGIDFGDGIPRHPVQLYESISMAVFLVIILLNYKKHSQFLTSKGFYFFVLFYASQRFIWEFLKPYQTLIVQLNLFHLLAITMIIYALYMLSTSKENH